MDKELAALGYDTSAHDAARRSELLARPAEAEYRAVESARAALKPLEDEIAKHQRVEEALREREKMLSLVVNAVPQTIFWKDTDLVYVGCNEQFARSAGLPSPSCVVGKTDYDLPWRPDEIEGYRRDDREVMRLDRPKYHFTESQQQPDGQGSARP